MKLTLGHSNIFANIRKLTFSKFNEKSVLRTQLDILVPEGNKDIFRGTPSGPELLQEAFVLVINNASYANQICRSNRDIVACLEQPQSFRSAAAWQRIKLAEGDGTENQYPFGYGGLLCSARSFNLEFFKKDVTDLTVFAGIVNIGPRDKLELVALQSVGIFSNGVKVSTNIVLYKDAGKTQIYLGPATQDGAGNWYIPPPSPRVPARKLYATEVPNDIVVIEQEKAEFVPDLKDTKPYPWVPGKTEPSVPEIINHYKKRGPCSYFSPLSVAKTDNGTLALTFSFNRTNYFKDLGAYGHLIKSEDELLSSFKLLSVRILRKRKTKNSATSELTLSHTPALDYDTAWTLVTDEVTFPAFTKQPGVVTIAAQDPSLADLKEGVYQYCVELEFLDRGQEKIDDILNNDVTGLNITLAELKELYTDATLTRNYDPKADQLRQDYLRGYLDLNPENQIDHLARERYLSAMAVFKPEYGKKEYYTKLKGLTSMLSTGPEGIDTLSGLIGELSNQIQREVKSFSAAPDRGSSGCGRAGDPVRQSDVKGSGDPGKRILTIRCCFENFVDASEFQHYGFDYLETPGTSDSVNAPFKTITYTMMDNILATENIKIEDVASARRRPQEPLTLTPNFFKLRDMKYEINSKDPAKDESKGVGQRLAAANLHKNSPLDLDQFELTYNPTSFPLGHVTQLHTAIAMMGFHSCEVKVMPDTEITATGAIDIGTAEDILFGDMTLAAATDGSPYLDAALKVSERSPFVINKEGHDSVANFDAASTNNSQDYNYLQEIVKIDPCILYHLIQTDYFNANERNPEMGVKTITSGDVFKSRDETGQKVIARASVQASSPSNAPATKIAEAIGMGSERSVISRQQLSYAHRLNSSQGSSNQIRGSAINEFALKYGLERKIQYLAGFRSDQAAGVQVGAPIWADLTRQDLDNFSKAAAALLCRLVDNHTEAGFSSFKGIAAPVYDKVFVIASGQGMQGGIPSRTQNSRGAIRQRTYSPQKGLYTEASIYGATMPQGVPENLGAAPQYIVQDSGGKQPRLASLYTDGSDFQRHNGKSYQGPYHIHIKADGTAVAMVGAFHTEKSHETLKALSTKVRKLILRATVQPGTAEAMTTATSPSRAMEQTAAANTRTGVTGGGGSY